MNQFFQVDIMRYKKKTKMTKAVKAVAKGFAKFVNIYTNSIPREFIDYRVYSK